MGQALAHTTAAHTIVFLYTAPIFTALGLQFLPEERLSRRQWAGIGVAFLGIVRRGAAATTGQTRVELSMMTILSLTFQTLIIAISSYLVWFWLLRRYLTSRLMLLSLMTPLFGVIFGAALLGDPIDTRFALGALMVLAGELIVNFKQIVRF